LLERPTRSDPGYGERKVIGGEESRAGEDTHRQELQVTRRKEKRKRGKATVASRCLDPSGSVSSVNRKVALWRRGAVSRSDDGGTGAGTSKVRRYRSVATVGRVEEKQ